jgi:hypothetical protein
MPSELARELHMVMVQRRDQRTCRVKRANREPHFIKHLRMMLSGSKGEGTRLNLQKRFLNARIKHVRGIALASTKRKLARGKAVRKREVMRNVSAVKDADGNVV